MQRGFSSDKRVDESTPLQNFTTTPGDSLDDSPAAAEAEGLSRSHQQQQQQQHFRPWTAMQTDRNRHPDQTVARGAGTGGKSDAESSSSAAAIHSVAIPMPLPYPLPSITKTNSPEHTQHKNSLDVSASFMSEPSVSEEELETIGSSQLDYQKKIFYRQKLREFDAQSVGDTSLSSSNISTSPQPQRFRIQFDSSSDHLRNSMGKVRNKVKAASDRLSFSSMMNSEGKDKTSRTSLDASVAPSPPTRESSKGSNLKIGQVLSEDSQSSIDSIRGTSLTTEQSGGENTSSSALEISNRTDASNNYQSREINPPNASQTNCDSKGSRRKGSRHFNMHSGDDVVISGGGAQNNVLNNAYRSRVLPASTRGDPSSWGNDSSSPFAHIEMDKSHWRTATWDGSREISTRSRTKPSSHPFIKSNTNVSLDNAHDDVRHNLAPLNSWLPPYQHPDGTQYQYQNLSPDIESYESDCSYGTSESYSSSSYTDSYGKSADNFTGTRQTPEYRKVQFVSDKEATKFDNAMRRVGSVLDKPREFQIVVRMS